MGVCKGIGTVFSLYKLLSPIWYDEPIPWVYCKLGVGVDKLNDPYCIRMPNIVIFLYTLTGDGRHGELYQWSKCRS